MNTTPPQPCPHLPTVTEQRPASALVPFRDKPKGPTFYLTALECAQSRWLEGLPAQAILMINRALTVNFSRWSDDERATLASVAFPYRALAFIIHEGNRFGFLGNPRRHFQHLATRMTGADKQLRIARAWACWAVSRKSRPDLIADEKQLTEEGIVEPTVAEISTTLAAITIDAEHLAWTKALHTASPYPKDV